MAYSLSDVEYFCEDTDDDGRPESLMVVFPDRTLVCVGDNDGDGLADYAAVDIRLTGTVDLAVRRNGGVYEMQLRGGDSGVFYEQFAPADFSEDFPGWAGLLAIEFPGGVPDMRAAEWALAVVNELLLPGWTGRRTPWREGGLYQIGDGDGGYSVVKVVKVDDIGVHIRQYSNRFDELQSRLDESELFLAPFDADSQVRPGMGHLPVSATTFRGWSPVFVQQSTVRTDELSGYQSWLEAGGGYF